MSATAPAPPRAPTPPDAPRPAGRIDQLSPRAFRTLLLAIAALAAAMAAEGAQTFAEMRERHFAILARQQAVSPVAYGTALHALSAAGGGGRVLVRADSAAADAAALCALAGRTAGDAYVRWVAFSADVDPCVARAAGARMLRAGAPAAAEMGRARWMVVDAEGRARYSRSGIPSPAELRQTAALLAPASPAEGAG
jgi:hypothetical protein